MMILIFLIGFIFHDVVCIYETSVLLSDADEHIVAILKNPKESSADNLITDLNLFVSLVNTTTALLKIHCTLYFLKQCTDVHNQVITHFLLYDLTQDRLEKIKYKLTWNEIKMKHFLSLMADCRIAWVNFLMNYQKCKEHILGPEWVNS